ncbi:MAG: glycosyltransferase [Rhodobacter sp.]|nr:glycosyltransferase [Rhodobacter sp.]
MRGGKRDRFVQQARSALRQHRIPQARAHLNRALALDGVRRSAEISLLDARLLQAEGAPARAGAVLEALVEARPRNIQAHLQLIDLAHRRLDARAMQTHQDRVLALDPVAKGVLTPEQMLQTELSLAGLLISDGAETEARARLERLRKDFPDRVEIYGQLAKLAWAQANLPETRAHLNRALALDPERQLPQVHLLHARLLRAEGAFDRAAAVLDALVEAYPRNVWVRQQLSEMARFRADTEAMRRHQDAAAAALKARMKRSGSDMQSLMSLIKAGRATGQKEFETECLLTAVAADPTNPQLLAHIYSHFSHPEEAELITDVTRLLRGRVDGELADDLEAEMLQRTWQYDRAYELERRAFKTRTNQADALRLAKALLRTQRYETGLRYLRRCVRRWPAGQPLRWTYVNEALMLGRFAEVAALLERVKDDVPTASLLRDRFLLSVYRGELETATSLFETLDEMGGVLADHRNFMTTLMFNTLDPAAGTIDRAWGSERGAAPPPHFRAWLVGQQAMEFAHEQRQLSDGPGFASPEDWLRARPGSTLAAIRVMDRWCSRQDRYRVADGDAADIPRRIFQYWDSPHVPAPVAKMIQSWSGAAGFTHELVHKADAVTFLREQMGPRWVRAFRLARSPAEEADLLRLCLLVRKGGVYADADDCLYGDLNRLLGAGRGLILYREAMRGGVGNNFIAAPPGHPAIRRAALSTRNALLQHSGETTWNKTGPGQLTRAVAQHLVLAEAPAAADITVLTWQRAAGEIGMHNPLRYKRSKTHWDHVARTEDIVWRTLQAELERQPH